MEIVEQILELYAEVDDIYRILRTLELKGLTQSDEFLSLINRLREILEKEEDLLGKLYDSRDYCDVYNEMSQQDDEMSKRFINYANRYEILVDEIFDDDDLEDIKDVQKRKFFNICMRNIYLVYLSFLQESIDNDVIVRKQLLTTKYSDAFVIRNMESMLVDYGFMVGQEVIIDLYFCATEMKIGMGLRKTVIRDTFWKIIEETLKTMLSISDSDRNCIDKLAVAVNAECMFRACLTVLSDDDYRGIKERIEQKIDELSNGGNTSGESVVFSYMENRKNYKKRVKKKSSGNIAN